MIRIHVFCEGQTEETFVRDVLTEHFARRGIWLNAILISTSKSNSRVNKGGIPPFQTVRAQIIRKSKEDPSSFVTTLFDYYGLPKDFPAFAVKENAQYSTSQKVESLEEAFTKVIDCSNFIPNFLLHEFEALLFTKPSAFSPYLSASEIEDLERQIALFSSPEEVNDSPETAPSKRILKLYPAYQKVRQGALIAQAIGLDEIRRACSHFDQWLTTLEALV